MRFDRRIRTRASPFEHRTKARLALGCDLVDPSRLRLGRKPPLKTRLHRIRLRSAFGLRPSRRVGQSPTGYEPKSVGCEPPRAAGAGAIPRAQRHTATHRRGARGSSRRRGAGGLHGSRYDGGPRATGCFPARSKPEVHPIHSPRRPPRRRPQAPRSHSPDRAPPR